MNLGTTVNTSAYEYGPEISADRLTLHFFSNKPGGYGSSDIYVTRRASIHDDWKEPVNLGPSINSSYADNAPEFSADGSTFYFRSNRPGGFGDHDLYQAPVIPIVDFNGNGIVDIKDLEKLIDCWSQNEPSVDMGPMPWGDGTVDEADLDVLMSQWGHEVDDPTLMACWKLDETEGDVAYDSGVQNDATILGEAIWSPEHGVIGGSLNLDGVDDYILTPHSILNPANGPFSVFAWIKGGAPGQVILSQFHSVNWLVADVESGGLRTDISSPIEKTRAGSEGGQPLISSAAITDGNWHRVGMVWDGTHRILYVDDIMVAEDMLPELTAALGALHIGAGVDLEEGTFWSGMIDDVRIYSRVVQP